MDSIAIFHNNIRRYLLTAVDLTSKFAFAYTYSSLSSLNGADFIEKLKKVSPFKIKRVQTDNGGEFACHFSDRIERMNIIHFHNYPKKPYGLDYLLWYNTEKPHRSLNKAPPLRYYVDTFLNPEESNMVWTPTLP